MLETLKLNELARLVQRDGGDVYLEYGTRLVGRQELVPYQVLGARMAFRTNFATMTATGFVEFCMRKRFGQPSHWPKLARDFAFPTYAHIFSQDTNDARNYS